MSSLAERRYRSGSDELTSKVELFEALSQVYIYITIAFILYLL